MNVNCLQIQILECEKSDWKKILDPIKKKVKEVEESESAARVALEKAERDANALKVENVSLRRMFEKSNAEAKRMENELKSLDCKFKVSFKILMFVKCACLIKFINK